MHDFPYLTALLAIHLLLFLFSFYKKIGLGVRLLAFFIPILGPIYLLMFKSSGQ
jgi:hypothetical protein